MEKPYIISEELDLDTYSADMVNKSNIGAFRKSLDSDLRAMGKNTLWVPARGMQENLNNRIRTMNLPVLSLDDRYVTATGNYLGISRAINKNLEDVGYTARNSYADIAQQLDSITPLGQEIIIADDVLFSGSMVEWLSDELAKQNVKIGAVICGIAINEGIQKMAERGIDVLTWLEYDDVDDEICERDLAVVPGSGRRLKNSPKNALYFEPQFGKPEQWASLPAASIDDFCLSSLDRSISLLRPDIPMLSLGSFLGYGTDGSAQNVLAQRIGELS